MGTADIPEGALVTGLMRLARNPEVNPAMLVEYLSDRAGLLLPRGVGIHTFPHRTFQEYLAAWHLTKSGYPDEVARLARQDPNKWREVAMLAGAKAGRGADFAVWSLVAALCPNAPGHPVYNVEDTWGASLAGQLLVETVGEGDVSEQNLVSEPFHRPFAHDVDLVGNCDLSKQGLVAERRDCQLAHQQVLIIPGDLSELPLVSELPNCRVTHEPIAVLPLRSK